MEYSGCNGKPKPEFIEKKCPKCGEMVEMMTTDVMEECDNCGTMVYNDLMSCALWCDHAAECLGKETYDRVMKAADRIPISDKDLDRLMRR